MDRDRKVREIVWSVEVQLRKRSGARQGERIRHKKRDNAMDGDKHF